MTKVTFDLTKAQSLIVAPLFDELRAMNDAAFAEGKDMAGAAISGQVFWNLGSKTPTAEIVLLDPKTALQMQKLLKRRKREREREEADLATST